jgi:hypothetical protein
VALMSFLLVLACFWLWFELLLLPPPELQALSARAAATATPQSAVVFRDSLTRPPYVEVRALKARPLGPVHTESALPGTILRSSGRERRCHIGT